MPFKLFFLQGSYHYRTQVRFYF